MLLCDTDRVLGQAYGAAASPDAGNAKRISYLIGPEGNVLRAYGQVNPQRHPNEILTDLGTILQEAG